MRDAIPGGGFLVDVVELESAAGELEAVAGEQTRAARTEYDPELRAQRGGETLTDRAGHVGDVQLAPGWERETDQMWSRRRQALLQATRAAAEQLRVIGERYLDVDDRVAAALAPPEHSAHRCPGPDPGPTQGPARTRQAAPPPRADHASTEPSDTGSSFAGHRTGPVPADGALPLERAVAVWRARGEAANRALFTLTTSVTAIPGWRGTAAEDYERWLQAHLQRWQAQHDDAERIHHTLADQAQTPPGQPPPPADPISLTGTGAGRPGDPPLVPGPVVAASDRPADAVTPENPSAGPAGADHSVSAAANDRHGGDAATTPVPASSDTAMPTRDLRSTDTPIPGTAAPSTAAPDTAAIPAPRAPGNRQSTGADAPSPAHPAAEVPTAPDRSDSMAPAPVSPAPTTEHHPRTADSPSSAPTTADDAALIGASSSATAAAAAAAMFARQDRGLHVVPTVTGPVVGQVTVSPGVAPPISGTTRSAVADALDAAATGLRRHGARPTAAGTRQTAACGHPTGQHPSSASDDDDAPTEPIPILGPADRSPTPPLWLDLASPQDPPARINLAAAAGVGLTGPRAPDIARTLLCRLLAHRSQPTVTIPAATLTGLLGPGSVDLPAHTFRGLRLLATPYEGLALADAETHRRQAQPDDCPLVLVLSSPGASAAQQQLAKTLAAGYAHGVTAVLLGPSPATATLHIDPEHRATLHTGHPQTVQDLTHPIDITGYRCHPTNAEDFLAALRASAPDHDPAVHHQTPHELGPHDHEPTPSDDAAEQTHPPAPAPATASSIHSPAPNNPGGTPLSLTVLGSTELRYLPDSSRDVTDHASAGIGDQPVTGLGRRGVELLLYLAAHPSGVSRDNIVATFWPDTRADRPANALHATLIRLRRALRAATDDPAIDDLVVHRGDKYRLNGDLVTVDYWTFLVAAADITAPDPATRIHACETAVAAYQGHFAVDHAGEWLIALRENTRRRYLDAIAALAQITITDDPDRTLGLLEIARNLEPLNEGIYRDIMKIHHQQQRHASALGTYRLLEVQLDDIDATPEPATRELAHHIRTSEPISATPQ